VLRLACRVPVMVGSWAYRRGTIRYPDCSRPCGRMVPSHCRRRRSIRRVKVVRISRRWYYSDRRRRRRREIGPVGNHGRHKVVRQRRRRRRRSWRYYLRRRKVRRREVVVCCGRRTDTLVCWRRGGNLRVTCFRLIVDVAVVWLVITAWSQLVGAADTAVGVSHRRVSYWTHTVLRQLLHFTPPVLKPDFHLPWAHIHQHNTSILSCLLLLDAISNMFLLVHSSSTAFEITCS